MKPLHIDFARPRRPARWAWMLCGVVAVAALGAVVAAIHTADRLQTAQAEVADLRQRAQDRAAARSAPPPSLPPPVYQADALRAVGEAEFATAAALTALEHTPMLGVTPVSVELLAEGRLAKVEVEFSDYAKLLSYLEELNTGEELARWQLIRATAKAPGQLYGTALLESRW